MYACAYGNPDLTLEKKNQYQHLWESVHLGPGDVCLGLFSSYKGESISTTAVAEKIKDLGHVRGLTSNQISIFR